MSNLRGSAPQSPVRDGVQATLERVRARGRRVRALETLLRALALLTGGALALFLLDNLLGLGAATREVLGGSLLGALALVLGRALLRRAPTQLETAILLERAEPGLDNRLVNAERLALDPATPPIVLELLRAEASPLLSRLDASVVFPLERLRPVLAAAGVALALFLGYAALAPARLANAFVRFALPLRFTPPLTRTTLAVEPGNVTVVEGASVLVRARTGGAIPDGARVRVGAAAQDMRFLGGDFVCEFKAVEAPFDYQVTAGDAESDVFHVSVLSPARLARIAVAYELPAYLGLPPRTEDPSSGNLAAVEGTHVTLRATTTKPVKTIRVVASDPMLPPLSAGGATWTFLLARSATYRLEWVDADGLEGKSPTYTIACRRDEPPAVKLVEPSRSLTLAASSELTTVVQASDDFGLAALELRAAIGSREPVPVAALDLPGSPREIKASRLLPVAALGARPGDAIGLFAVARDKKGQETTSNVVQLLLADDAKVREELQAELLGIAARLRKILEAERRLRDDTVAAQALASTLAKAQAAVLEALLQVHASWTNPELRHLAARARLAAAIRGPATDAVSQILKDRTAAAASQATLISELEAVIAELEGLAARLATGDLAKTLAQAADKSQRQEAKDLLAGLKDFLSEQRKAIEETQDLKPKAGEDFTDEQKKKLEAIKQTEEKWGKYLAEKATDLSKVPPQDFSNGEVVKDLLGASSEVKQAANSLAAQATEVAVAGENAGLELAKELVENIERWLANGPDSTKWVMEEPKGPADVPMANLPSALEDLVGDLLDKEDELAEKSQDVTNSLMDSMDKGVGWAASDGPESNGSAKGITGNQQPNSNEIAGRSGEGRSGKSSGQMVGDQAVGKGGKQTPTRVTPDAYEAGRVKDSSKDASGGSTGGGKVSGGNKEGLRGAAPPPIRDKMERLAEDQADIRNTAEKAKVALEKRGYVSTDLARAVEKMKAFEGQLHSGERANYGAAAKAIAEELGAVQRTVRDQLEVTRDPMRSGSRSAREELVSQSDEAIPAEFRDAVKEYYKALSEH
jgi:hypothetical protein